MERPVLAQCNTVVGAYKKTWWHWGDRGVFICRCISRVVDTPFCGVLRRSSMKKRLGNTLLPRNG